MVALGDEWMGRPANPTPRTKYAHACRLFEQAADVYRTFGRWRSAGEAYFKAGEAEKKQAELLIASTYYTDAGECMERVDADEAVGMYLRAIGLYASLGRFMSAGTLQSRVAELYEADGALTQAAEAYQYACDYFLGDDLYSQAVKCLWHSGACLAQDESFGEAGGKFEKAAGYAMDDNLLKLKVPELMFDACLCRLAVGDLGAAEGFVNDCSSKDPNFTVGRERRFLLDVIDTARSRDVDAYMDHCWNFDYVDELDPWEVKMLEVILEMIQAGPVERKDEESSSEEEGGEDDDDEER